MSEQVKRGSADKLACRDQGDGESEPEIVKDPGQSDSSVSFSQWPLSVHVQVDLAQVVLFLVALITRLYLLDHPHAIVFDELHYGRFASLYQKRVFFFDTQPPLGKLLLALAAYLAGYDGEADFKSIGSAYTSDVPVWSMRAVPAVFGSLLVPTVYQVIVELQLSRYAACLACLLLVLDTALLTQCRFMHLEGILLFFMALSLLTYLKFSQVKHRPFSKEWWVWLSLCGISCALSLSTKYVGFFTVVFILSLVLRDVWHTLPNPKLSNMELLMQGSALGGLLIILPLVLYTGVFYVHLSILNKAGPHDDIMTSAFQASLEGGLASITQGQPLHVAYGSQVTLRNTYGRPCWLHSHKHVYPIRYPDNRGSSHQQQVTCYSFKDVNNWWIIKDPRRNIVTVDEPVRPVQHGDIIQLVHGVSSRALNSHDVAAPLSTHCQEVSCYINYNISMAAQNLWRVELLNHDTEGTTWRTIQSHVRLVHINSTAALKMTGQQLPDWGFYQFEVAADRQVEQEATVWNVEEHRYTRSSDEQQRAQELSQTPMIPIKPTHMGFLSKFLELQIKMLTVNHDNPSEHRYSSHPVEWPLCEVNVAYWAHKSNNAQIQLVGNIVIWYAGNAGTLIALGLLVLHLCLNKRNVLLEGEDTWRRYTHAGEVLLVGYLVHYVPFFITDRSLFLHHYLPALVFKLLLLAATVDAVYTLMWPGATRMVFLMLILIWLTSAASAFHKFSVFSYGVRAPQVSEVQELLWLNSWDFFTNK